VLAYSSASAPYATGRLPSYATRDGIYRNILVNACRHWSMYDLLLNLPPPLLVQAIYLPMNFVRVTLLHKNGDIGALKRTRRQFNIDQPNISQTHNSDGWNAIWIQMSIRNSGYESKSALQGEPRKWGHCVHCVVPRSMAITICSSPLYLLSFGASAIAMVVEVK
jgi:hypothetical protein